MPEKIRKRFYFITVLFCLFFLTINVSTSYAKKVSSRKKVAKQSLKNKKVIAKNGNLGQKKYVIKKGDTLAKIAKSNGCDVDTLQKLNPELNPKKMRQGMAIKLPVVASKIEKKDKERELVYRVKKGDTLYSIAKRYNLSEEEIKRLNRINDEHIVAGMTLLIKNLQQEKGLKKPKEFYSLTDVDEEDFGEDAEGDTKDLTLLDNTPKAPSDIKPPYTLTKDKLEKMLSYSLDFLGTDYKYGGSTVSAIDCSAFVKTVFKEIDINLPRTSREQFAYGVDVSLDELKEGDLLFFAKKKRISHVGIYIGNDMFIHAARRGKGVIVTKLDSPYVKKHFVGAKRLFTLEDEKQKLDLKKDLSLAEKPLIN